MTAYLVFLALLAAERVFELRLSRRNAERSDSRQEAASAALR